MRFARLMQKHVGWLAAALLFAAILPAQDVLTYHNDLARTGLDSSETILTPSNVNSGSFGKLFVLSVDGKVDAQPLYVSGVTIPNNGMHNVLVVATEHDSVYGFDADNGSELWQVSLLLPGETTSDDRGCDQVEPEIGITATPVIDRAAGPDGAIYVVAMSKDSSGTYHQRLHALDLTTGQEEFGGPKEVQAQYPGSGDNSSGGNVIFDPKQYKERPGLVLLNSTVYTFWSSHCDIEPYTGWIIGYGFSTLAQTSVFNITPNGSEGSIWASGAAPAVDASGNIYFLAANGTFDMTLNAQGFPSLGDYGNAFVKISVNGSTLSVADYFNMFNTVSESSADEDLGSGGALVLPDMTDSNGVTRHLAVGAGKDQNIYLVDRDNMGKFNPASNNIYQELPSALGGQEFGMPAYFANQIYYGAAGDSLRAFQFSTAQLQQNPSSVTSTQFTYPGTTPSVSANGTTNGIVWAIENTDPAVLHAYDALDLTHELYNSNQAGPRDQFGTGNKFITPTIANGKVYVATTSGVGVFGLLSASSGPDFSMSSSPSSASVTAGQSATYTVSVTPAGGFNQPVALTCTGAPMLATCAITPSSVTPNGSSPATATVTVSTTGSSIALPRRKAPPDSWWLSNRAIPVFLLLMAVCLLGLLRALRPRPRWARATFALTALLFVACGSGGSVGHNSGTPSGNYSLNITGASTAGSTTLTHSVTLSLTVM